MSIFKNFSYGVLVFLVSFFSAAANVYAAPLALSSVPLFTGNPITSNVFFQMDDSGSMDWEVMTQKHWHFCAYDSNAGGASDSSDCGWFVDNGLLRSYNGSGYEYFNYMYSEADNAYSSTCDGSTDRQSYEDCSSSTAIDSDWRARSADVNVIYYSPNAEYQPWQGTGMVDASFSAARSDPQSGKAGYSNTRNLAGFIYEVWDDDKGFTTSATVDRPRRGANLNSDSVPNGIVDLWDSHYQVTINASSFTIKKISYMPGAGGLNPTTKTVTSGDTDYNAVLAAVFGESTPGTTRTLAEVQQNIANWYEYSRRRAFVAKAATAAVITDKPGFRYGFGLFQNALFKEMPAANVTDFSSHNKSLLEDFFKYSWTTQNTHLRTGLERVGEYYKGNLSGKSSPIIAECQQNFTVLMTDGFWNGGDPNVGNADGDAHSNTAADVAKYYYDQDLRTDLADNVPKTTNRKPVELNDNNTQQHMVTFTAAFGVEGSLTDTNNDGWPDPLLLENGNWGDPSSSDLAKIDDLWHAAFNSKGDFVSARTPDDLVKGLNDTLGAISDRTGAASSLASNSTNLNSGTALYQALFVSGEWSGDVRKLMVSDGNANSGVCKNVKRGSVCTTPVWNAETQLDQQDYQTGREIISYNPVSDTGVSFEFPANYDSLVGGTNDSTKLSDAQIQALLTNAPNAANTAVSTEISENQSFGNDLVAFLRGDRSNEGKGRGFRIRGSKLGDIIHSGPVFVGKPNFNFSDDLETVSYSSFATANANRTQMIYVAGNDGMLHAFDDATGNEKLAFIPSEVYSNLPKLAEPTYSHEFFVDGSPSVGDAFYTGAWHTVLVGGLNAGGKSVYALDVTDPSSFNETNADKLVLWEFTDPDLGFTYGTPTIVKMNNGEWAAVFGNGYNSGGTGQSAVYIVKLEDGTVIKKILTGAGSSTAPNGISHITPIDTNGDAIADYLFGGDLLGNMWKFDVSNKDASKWDVAYKTGNGPTAVPAPIFTATVSGTSIPQPITVAPEIISHPDSSLDGFLVLFGTGKYLESTDNTPLNQDTQTFYAIWDQNQTSLTAISKATDLLQQEVTEESYASFDLDNDGTVDYSRDVRITTEHTVDWTKHKGWYLDLINTEVTTPAQTNKGERQVTRPIVRNNTVFFTTLMPSGNPCDAGGVGWIMGLDAASGARKPASVFDVNNDGDIDDGDRYKSAVVSGVRFVGFISDPRFIGDSGKDHGFVSTTASDKPEELATDGSGNSERVSWRQIINE